LAYFSPLPPKRTGVADYAAHLANALAAHAEIDFFDSAPSVPPSPDAALIDYVARPETLLSLSDYDAVLYQLGNNPEFHAHIFRAFLTRPGPVVLHDTVLYFLMAGLDGGGMLREFLYNYGPARLAEFFKIERDSPENNVLRYPYPERYPFLRRVFAYAPRIIVHSATSAGLIRAAGYEGRIEVVPLLAYPPALAAARLDGRARTREELGLAEGQLLLGSFGFFGRTKRFPTILSALARLTDELDFKLLIVGEGGGDLRGEIAAAGLEDRITLSGFVDDAAFSRLLGALDILLNPRYPSMGETSATQIQAMASCVPSVVSDHAWFAELPDEAVFKIGVGEAEEEGLVAALRALATDQDRRRRMGEAARSYIASYCMPNQVAARYAAILGDARSAP
jgi:glycosyltransferase involved in cell wall biosynthesis